MIMIFLYGSLAVAWNILAGYCGQISLGHAVFFGIGAYTSTLLVARAGVSPWLGMLAGAVLAVIVSQAVGFPVFRLRGHYFAIATIAVGEIVQTLFINWDWAGGARGVFVPIRRPDSFVNFQFNESKAVYYYIALGLLLLGVGTLWGPVVGAAVLVPLSEYTRVWLGGTGKALDLVIYGALIVLVAVAQPSGLVGLARRLGRRYAPGQ